jgi:DNA polymerase I-like protein with 3'-5' exonuclease and polymerase domains
LKTYFLDTETVGLTGPAVLIQYAIDDGPITLHEVWKEPIGKTLDLIEDVANNAIIGFNLSFDWFQLYKLYTMFSDEPRDNPPTEDYSYWAKKEMAGRDHPNCLKPAHVLDLLLNARKGPYQSTMDRSDIRIKKVPKALAQSLCDELSERIPLKDVYFARRKDKTIRWQVFETKEIDPVSGKEKVCEDFRDIVLKFSPSSALKALAIDALGLDVTKFDDISIGHPLERGYAPYALAPFIASKKEGTQLEQPVDDLDCIVSSVDDTISLEDNDPNESLIPGTTYYPSPDNWYGKWPEVISKHIEHWGTHKEAREYAENDVVYTRGLYHFFNNPVLDDIDSVLACMVATVRWRGFKVNIEALKKLKEDAQARISGKSFNFQAAAEVREYIGDALSPMDRKIIGNSTKSEVLEKIIKEKEFQGTEVAKRAAEVLDARHAKKEIEIYDKLLLSDRFHASLNVIGTLSGRMSGSDGLNPQGINHGEHVRSCFPLAWDGFQLIGGDFASFEVMIADAVYNDPVLHDELLAGGSIHAHFGTYMFDKTYEEICATKKLEGEADLYKRAKMGIFALLYGGEAFTISKRLGVSEAKAEDGYQRFIRKYKVLGNARKGYADLFCSMKQTGEIGSPITWAEPADYVESKLGHKRYFTLENSICKVLYKLAEKPPAEWLKMKMKVTRRDRVQTTSGAARSALFAAAFAVQASNMRAGGNHVIQSTGAGLTKLLQGKIWELQPSGAAPWVVQPLQIHDEILCPTLPERVEEANKIVADFIQEYRAIVPLLEIEWKDTLSTWADK